MTGPDRWAAVTALLGGEAFDQFLIPGYTDHEKKDDFRIFPFSVFLRAGGKYLRLSSVDQGDQLELDVRDAIDHDPSLVEDDDVTPGVVDLTSLYFGEVETVRCRELVVHLNGRSSLLDGRVKYAELVLDGGQRILFDPLWTFGVRAIPSGSPDWLDRHAEAGQPLHVERWSRD